MKKKEKSSFSSGVVTVKFKKDLPYFMNLTDVKLVAIDGVSSQFKKGDKTILCYDKAGLFSKHGYCDILDEYNEVINTKEAANA